MRNIILALFLSVGILLLVSWGYNGHRTVALISERHLTPQAKAAVHDLLGKQSLAEIASWADEVRNEPEYKITAPWHFINTPLGLDYQQFSNAVKSSEKSNVYKAILEEQMMLKNSKEKAQRIIALKFLVHFVGDVHQPMHVSRSEDKGGNTIQVQFDGKGTNLHSLWDSKLLDKEGLSDDQLVNLIDNSKTTLPEKATQADPMQWAWESYQLSSKLYQEIEAGNKLGDDYYKKHIATVHERLELAGLRLAQILNTIFKDYKPGAPQIDVKEQVKTAAYIPIKDVAAHIGEEGAVTGKVYGYKDFGSIVLLNVGAEYPNQPLTVVLRGENKSRAKELDGKEVTFVGKIINYKGKPEIEVRKADEIIISNK